MNSKGQALSRIKIGGNLSMSTPQAIINTPVGSSAPMVNARSVSPNLSVKGNAQSDAYGRAMRSAYNATKVFK